MARVKCRWALFRLQVRRVLRERGICEIEVDAVGGAVERLGPSVSGKAGQAVPGLKANGSLQSVVSGIGAVGEDVDSVEGRVCAGLVGVVETRKLRALAADVADFERRGPAELLLDVEIPIPDVRCAEIAVRDENALREDGGSEDGRRGSAGIGESGSIIVQTADKAGRRSDGIGGYARGRSEIGYEIILREVIVIQPVTGANHGVAQGIPRETDARAKIVQVSIVEVGQRRRAHQNKIAAGVKVGKKIVLFAQRAEVLPAEAKVESEIRPHADVILGEKAQAVVEGETVGVAGVRRCEEVSLIEGDQVVDDRIAGDGRGVDIKDAALEVVVEALDIVAVVFAAELNGMAATNPGEIVERLKSFAETPARQAESAGAEIFNRAVEIEFGKTQLPRAEIQSETRGRIEGVVNGAETSAEARVAEAKLVQLGRRKSCEQAGGNDLHASR